MTKNLLLFIVVMTCVTFAKGQNFDCFPYDVFERTASLDKNRFGATIIDVQATPVAVDISEPFSFTIELDKAVDSIVVENFLANTVAVPNEIIVIDPGAGHTLFLDDGNGNDLEKEDFVYTCRNIMPLEVGSTNISTTSNGKFQRFTNVIMYKDGLADTTNFDLAAGIRFMNLDSIGVPEVKVLNDSVQTTEYVMNVAYDYEYGGPRLDIDFINSLSSDYVDVVLEDDNDFLHLNYTSPTPGAPAGSESTLNNTTTGTGVRVSPPNDFLKFPAIINLFFTYNGDNGRSIFVHEVNHRYCSWITETGLSSDSYHWGFIERPSNAFGAGNSGFFTKIEHVNADTFSVSTEGATFEFCDLELYLHGQISIDEVDFPVRGLRNATRISSELYKGELIEVTKADLLNSYGPRVPAYSNGNKRITTLVVSDKLLSARELAYFDYGTRSLEGSLSETSGGLMTVTPKLRFLDKDGDGDNYFFDRDDNDSNMSSQNVEVVYNGIDDDCDPVTIDDDLDQDGYLLVEDCDDSNPNINPTAEEIPNNGIDEDCDGQDLVTSGVYEIDDTTISIYPNPVSQSLYLDYPTSVSMSLSLYDINYKLLWQGKQDKVVDVSAYPPGLYLLRLEFEDSDAVIFERIVVE